MVKCTYCDIAYATSQPNCRGCGAPKTADAIRRQMDADSASRMPVSPLPRLSSLQDEEPPSTLEVILSRGPGAVGAIFLLFPMLLMFGPLGLIVLIVLIPRIVAGR